MPKTKKELVDEILSIEEVDTKSNLMKKSVKELEEISFDLQGKSQSDKKDGEEVDIEALKQQLKEEMMKELKEQARKEFEEELKNKEKEMPVNTTNTKKEIDRFKLIPVMNVTNGKLIYHSKRTGAEWIFSRYGDIEYIEFQELLTMRSSQRRFFDEPFILVMDDDVVEYLGLRKMYDSMVKPEAIDEIFNMSQNDFEEVVEKAPKGIKHLIVSRAKELYDQGVLDSVRKINYLNKRFNCEIGQRG
jgi:hypothetical protein